jgi:hypothetical protein
VQSSIQRHWYKRKIQAYKELYQFTFNQCGQCVESGCACKDSICQHVEERAKKNGTVLKREAHALRFIGCNGCVVPPHQRETCTIYLCERAQKKSDFNRDRYEQLKRIVAKIEWRLMELEG